MVLVDTSVWIEHLRRTDSELTPLLSEGAVLGHPAVVGELACGHLRRRKLVIDLLRKLPRATCASDEEALRFLEDHRLFGQGLGWVDVHLLAAARLSSCDLWTLDRNLRAASVRLGVAYARLTS